VDWTFTIRDDVKFQDGTPLTVDDVVFSLNDTYGPTAIAESTTGSIVSLAENTESVTKVDDHTVQVKHKEPVPSFASILSPIDANLGGVIMPKAYFEKVGRDGYNQAPIGAGPFKVTEIRPGEAIVMERFDDYYNTARKPQFKTLTWNLVPEVATRVQALQAGQADIIAADITQQSGIEAAGGRTVLAPESAYVRLTLAGCWKAEFACSDPRVREALDLAIDKPLVMGQLYGDSWQNKGWAFVSPSSLGYSSDLDPTPADPAKAKQLLADAGYPDGENFPTLIINTATDATVPKIPDLGLLLAQQWHDTLGIPTEVRVTEQNTLRVAFNNRELDGGVYLAPNTARWDGASIANSGWGNLESGTRNHEDPALIQKVKDAQTVLAPAERDAVYNELYKEFKATGYEAGLGSLSLVWGVGPRIADWKPWPLVSRVTSLWTVDTTD
jgi:peptide/nickel transport system substrate-binding protein